MRPLATVVCSLVMAFAAIGLAVAAPGRDHDPARAALDRASGAVSIANSHEAHAILQAANISPGWSDSGNVQIRNDGDVAGRFTLTKTAVPVDVPGPNGGQLSQRLVLEVDDITGGGNRRVFFGPPSAFAAYDLGTLVPGAQRSFRFTAALPDGGPSDNLLQGSSMSMGFAWRAVAPTPKPKPTPPPTTTPTPAPTPTPTPTPTLSLADQLGLPSASKCVKTSKLKFKLKAPAGTKLKSAVITINGKVKARLKGAKLKKTIKLRGLRKKTKLKVTVRTTARKTLKASRTYKACRKR